MKPREKRPNELIHQLLSARPEARGTPEEMACKLEEAAVQVGPEADHPLFAWEALSPTSESKLNVAIAVGTRQPPRRRDRQVVRLSEQRDAAEKAELERQEVEELARASALTERAPARAPRSLWRPRLIALVVGVLVTVGSWWAGTRHSVALFTVAPEQAQPEAGKAEGRAVALGDEALPRSTEEPPSSSPPKSIRKDLPSKPFNGQLRPPCPERLCRGSRRVLDQTRRPRAGLSAALLRVEEWLLRAPLFPSGSCHLESAIAPAGLWQQVIRLAQ